MDLPSRIEVASIARRLARAGFVAEAKALTALSVRSWRLIATRAAVPELARGRSRFGGEPDLPAGFVWPRRAGVPMDFLAQLDLATLGIAGLPATGWLLFFFDVDDKPWGLEAEDAGGGAVVHIEASRAELTRTARPPGGVGTPSPGCALDLRLTVDIPDAWDSLIEHLELEERIGELGEVAAAIAGVAGREPYNHVFGHPQPLQAFSRSDCQLVAHGIFPVDLERASRRDRRRAQARLEAHPESWRLLLQLDSDPAPGWMWADAGRLYFWIRDVDLAAANFANVVVFLQC